MRKSIHRTRRAKQILVPIPAPEPGYRYMVDVREERKRGTSRKTGRLVCVVRRLVRVNVGRVK